MKTILISYISALGAMLVIDAVWLWFMSRNLYNSALGHLLADKPSLLPAGVFYLLYIFGLVTLVLLPAISGDYSLTKVILLGAVFGLVAYGTYDLTNQATLRDWPVVVTIVDLGWGALLTGLVSVISVYLTRYFS